MRIQLEVPTRKREAEFIAATQRSRRFFAGFVGPPSSSRDYGDYVKRCRSSSCEGRLVVSRESNELLGVVNVNEIVRRSFQSGILGYYAFFPHGGRGYMREALQALLAQAFGSLSLHRVEANIQPSNEKSIALVRLLGFRLEGLSPRYLKVAGRWRDHERWALLAEDRKKTGKGSKRGS